MNGNSREVKQQPINKHGLGELNMKDTGRILAFYMHEARAREREL
jgi:hypothetical protein